MDSHVVQWKWPMIQKEEPWPLVERAHASEEEPWSLVEMVHASEEET